MGLLSSNSTNEAIRRDLCTQELTILSNLCYQIPVNKRTTDFMAYWLEKTLIAASNFVHRFYSVSPHPNTNASSHNERQ